MNDQASCNPLADVVAVIERSYPPEKGGGLLMAAEMFTNYFKRPQHEITMDMMNESTKLLPLFLSSRRLPLDLIDLVVAEAVRLVKAAKLIERKRKTYKQPKRRMFLQLDDCDLSMIYQQRKAKKAQSTRRKSGAAIEAIHMLPEPATLLAGVVSPTGESRWRL
jgi:hypothetical protein